MAESSFPVHFNGQKYNIKQFLRDHPGGVNTLKNFEGLPVLKAMEKFNHSTNAYHMLRDFKVSDGVLDGVIEIDDNLTGSVSENGRIITKAEGARNVEEIAFLEELENRLDWSKPLLSQLDAIAPHYEKWVNCAVYRRCTLFGSPWMEALTYTPWYVLPVFWMPLILYLGCSQFIELVACGESCTPASLTVPQYLYHVAVGALIWSGLEYVLHRFVFHLDPGSSLPMIKMHFLLHGLHHKLPFDGLRQVFPPVPAFLITCVIYAPISVLMSYPRLKLTGGLIGYLTYDMIHYYVHHGSPRDGTYLYAMKRYHSNHHFLNHDKAFGISSKMWDYVFKTFVEVKKLGFSLKW